MLTSQSAVGLGYVSEGGMQLNMVKLVSRNTSGNVPGDNHYFLLHDRSRVLGGLHAIQYQAHQSLFQFGSLPLGRNVSRFSPFDFMVAVNHCLEKLGLGIHFGSPVFFHVRVRKKQRCVTPEGGPLQPDADILDQGFPLRGNRQSCKHPERFLGV